MRNTASIYNEARHHAFSLFHKGLQIKDIGKYINQQYQLPITALTGLVAELNFYNQYQDKYQLTVALDCGDKADFVGEINGKSARIDVTTNLHYKSLDDYNAPIDKSGNNYYLAHMDRISGNLIDIISLNVPRTFGKNYDGRLIDLVILRGPDYDKEGCSRHNPYQELITVNTHDYEIVNHRIVTDWYIEEINSFVSGIPDEMDDSLDTIIEEYCFQTTRFLNRTYGVNILGCLSYEYHYCSPDGDGEYGYYLKWLHPLLMNHKNPTYRLNEEFYIDL